jgi:Family of unknown function (DUF6231)
MEPFFQARLASLKLRSVLEITSEEFGTPSISDYCQLHNIQYRHTQPQSCPDIKERFDLAIVHHIETTEITSLRTCLGLLKNLISERVWLLVAQNYCQQEEWISLGFKRDSSFDALPAQDYASYSYNLETYNRKREWNNSRYWANPQHWDKRF